MAALLSLLLVARASPAQSEEPASLHGAYSPYEQQSIDDATAQLGAALDPRPDGKTVEAIDIVALEVIEQRDPAPGLLNVLHTTTRSHVIEREVLMRPGDRYRSLLCDETARNLRLLVQVSLVICTATAGSTPDQVRVLVLTKDVWSLRLGWNLSFIGGGIESLQIVPTESNLAGTHQVAVASILYQPESESFGIGYQIPRIEGLRLSLATDASIIRNRHGYIEGSTGSVGVAAPLYSARTEWAWAVGSSYRDEILRRYINARLATFDAVVTPQPDAIPWEYHARRFAEGAYATRSFGWAIKHDVTFGAEMNLRDFRPPQVAGADPLALAEFARRNLPTSDTRVGPFIQYRSYTSNFLRVLDFESLGLQEDFRLGHDVYAKLYPVTTVLGSSRNFVGGYAALQYTIGLGGGLLRAAVDGVVEAEERRISDGWIAGALHLVTPRIWFSRLVFDVAGLNRYRNYLNRASYLGGDTRLRGYPSNYFLGKDVVAYNAELRTSPLEVLSCQLGGALFYDAGHAANGLAHLELRHTVGVGVRVLFPQLDRVVFRSDIGFPLNARGDPGVSPIGFSISFEQAFPVPSVGGRVSSGPATGWLGQ